VPKAEPAPVTIVVASLGALDWSAVSTAAVTTGSTGLNCISTWVHPGGEPAWMAGSLTMLELQAVLLALEMPVPITTIAVNIFA
jgi:hypothetical protein